jgi:hypothetical protein
MFQSIRMSLISLLNIVHERCLSKSVRNGRPCNYAHSAILHVDVERRESV